MNTNMTVFGRFSKFFFFLVLQTKVALALEGLKYPSLNISQCHKITVNKYTPIAVENQHSLIFRVNFEIALLPLSSFFLPPFHLIPVSVLLPQLQVPSEIERKF